MNITQQLNKLQQLQRVSQKTSILYSFLPLICIIFLSPIGPQGELLSVRHSLTHSEMLSTPGQSQGDRAATASNPDQVPSTKSQAFLRNIFDLGVVHLHKA